jgi:AcrR family transcriptional regulator
LFRKATLLARRADHTKEELVAMTIAAARDLIAGQGIANFSARALSREIGYTAGTLYHHFKDLDDIVTQVNGLTLAGVGEAFAAAKRSSDPRKMLHNYADAFVGYIFENQRLWEALFDFKRAEGVPVPHWYRDSIEGLAHAIAPCFLKLREGATEAEAAEAAKLIFASIHSVVSLHNSGRLALLLDRDTKSVVHELVDIHITAFLHR